jgi:hypothetical protein
MIQTVSSVVRTIKSGVYGPSLGSNATYILACRYLRDEFGWGLHVFPAKDGGSAMKMPFDAMKSAMLKTGFRNDFGVYMLEGLHRSETVQACVETFERRIDTIGS